MTATIAILIVLGLSLVVQGALLYHLWRERAASRRRGERRLELAEQEVELEAEMLPAIVREATQTHDKVEAAASRSSRTGLAR